MYISLVGPDPLGNEVADGSQETSLQSRKDDWRCCVEHVRLLKCLLRF